MASINGDSENPPGDQHWQDFCERQAIITSKQFVRDFLVFNRSNESGNNSIPYDPSKFAKKFVECFLQHFEKEVKRTSYYVDSQQTKPKGAIPSSVAPSPPPPYTGGDSNRTSVSSASSLGQNGTGRMDRIRDDYDDSIGTASASPSVESHHQSPTHTSKAKGGLLRRLSFRNFRKRSLFHKHGSDETDSQGQVQGSSHRKHKHSHSKSSLKHDKSGSASGSTKSEIEEIKKEGIVSVLTGEDAKGKSRWEKTRMVLMKSNGGFLLEFYSPPKTSII
ncbi:hypothetical protein KUTeg_010488 [Tegillarca granosa]|uniref:Phenylalanine zipper domain-containing protein n=1 Tax=Tegillarca granosa TaxID=220873 RepID=A0ABQ9F6V1_TEGGR|nr:hypothetical protein KUTeg_010488 [Tegillarca granosa]